jgi:hypothetical protein
VIIHFFSTDRIHALEKYQQIFAWGVPLFLSTIPILVTIAPSFQDLDGAAPPLEDSNQSFPFYSDAQLWCWISPYHMHYRMVCCQRLYVGVLQFCANIS